MKRHDLEGAMMPRHAVIGLSALLVSLATASSVSTLKVHPLRLPAAPGGETLVAIGVRGANPPSPKLDGALADLVRHASRVRPGHALGDLHALSPAARFARSSSGASMVVIDAVTRGDPQALKSALVALGLEHPAVYRNDVSGFLPVSQIANAAARDEVLSLRAALVRRRATQGPVATQGDFAQGSAAARTQYPSLTGAGVTVAVLSDSFNCFAVYAASGSGVPASGAEGYAPFGFTADYATDIATGALPANVTVVAEPDIGDGACLGYQNPDSNGQPTGLPFSDEGRAMLQIVHAVAPGAGLVFRTGAVGEADFASGIEALAGAPYNAKVIADDLGYFDEPFFQDGILAQAIDTVEGEGVAYFSAAGNNQETPSYYNTTAVFNGTPAAGAPNAGEQLLNFDASGDTQVYSLPVTIPPLSPGDFVAIVVEWNQPYVTGSSSNEVATSGAGSTSAIDVCISPSAPDVLLNYDNEVVSCSGASTIGADPYQIMLVANPAVGSANTASQTINIQVGVASGTLPGQIIVAVEDDGQGSTINQFSPNGPTLQGHPGAAGAAAVGAAPFFSTPNCGTTPAVLEPYSAAGGLPILFNASGAAVTPTIRQKPDFVGPDGVNNTFLGFTLADASITDSSTVAACKNNASYPNFFGTSAATPHAGAVAALMLQANSSLTPTDIYDMLHMTAVAMPVMQSIASCAAGTQPNFCAGYGFIQAQKALEALTPGTPTLTLAASSIAANSSTTVTWSSPIATGCTASGSWSGSLAAAGSQTITPTTAGTNTYTLTCANANGSSATPASVKLTVTPASSGGGGGGALGGLSLLGLLALWGARRVVGSAPGAVEPQRAEPRGLSAT
jgi:hypothetical protein